MASINTNGIQERLKVRIMPGTKICPYCNNEINVYALKCHFCGEWQEDNKVEHQVGDTLAQVRVSLSDKYEVLEEIGRGGMAVVYKARQLSLNRLVALKVVHQNLVHDHEFLSRFHREAQLSASLDHPNIVTVHDTGREGMVHYVAMEYLEGQNLQEIIKGNGGLEVEEALDYVVSIADALDYAHNREIIHRDIKSSNIFITRTGRPVLMDFGIAHAASQTRLTMSSSILGTPQYMSPEQAEGVQVDQRTDVYSLGVVLYEALTGRLPFQGDNPLSIISHVKQTAPPTPSLVNKKIPNWLEQILLRTLAKKPEHRVQTARQLAELIKNKKVPRKARKKGKLWLKIAVILMLLVLAGGVTYYFLDDVIESPEPGHNKYLELARDAYDRNQYLTPEKESALHYAGLLLQVPANNDSLEGFKDSARIIKSNIYSHYKKAADQNLKKGRVETATENYRKALEVFPDKRKTIINNCLQTGQKKLKDLKTAEALFHDSVGLSLAEMEPPMKKMITVIKQRMNTANTLKEHLSEGHQHYDAGRFYPALTDYKEAMEILPDNKAIRDFHDKTAKIATYVQTGRQYLGQNNCSKALAVLRRAENLAGDHKSLNQLIRQANNCFSIGLEMVRVKGGSFRMGCQNQQSSCDADEKPAHTVKLSGFSISKHEITNNQYCQMLNELGNPEQGGAKCLDLGDSKIQKQGGRFVPQQGYENHPVSGVTWHGARAFCRWLSRKTNQTYRLPREAEWEYAARGGQRSEGFVYSGSNKPLQVAWFSTNKTHPVGQKSPNELGIYDMSGNVAEWCYDRYDNDYYKNSPGTNPRNDSNGRSRVIRGGHWAKGASECRVANRTSLRPDYSYEIYGFRVCSN